MTQLATSRARRRFALLAALTAGVPCLLAVGCTAGPAVTVGPVATEPATPANAPSAARQPTRKTSAMAVRLLRMAAQAAVRINYQGEEHTFRSDAGGDTLLISNVVHTGAGPTVMLTQASGPTAGAQYQSSDAARDWPEGVLGVTAELVGLLARNYVITYGGVGTTINRPADLVEVWRTTGSLAARYWLDSSTRLPLEREVYDPAANLISLGDFVNIQIGKPAGPAFKPAQASINQARVSQAAATAWAHPLTTPELMALARHGWAVPAKLPGGLTLFAAGQNGTKSAAVLDLAYSDGLFVESVFEQHGKLAPHLAGWQETKLNGVIVYAAVPDQRSYTWTGKGIVYTLIADATVQEVGQTVRALPHDQPPGFWHRVGHGLARLAALANPFG